MTIDDLTARRARLSGPALREIREGVALLCGRLGGDPNAPGVYTISPQPDGRVRLTVDVTFDPAGLDLMVRALATLPEGA